jgi:hypothetical protein
MTNKEQCLKHDLLPDYEQKTLKPFIGKNTSEPDGVGVLVDFKCSEVTGREECSFECVYMRKVKNGKLIEVWREDKVLCYEENKTG